MNIELLLEEFCQHANFIKGYSPDTIKRYKQMVTFFMSHKKLVNIEEITEDVICDFFLYGRIERKWQNNTYITYHKTLLVFLRFCVKKGHIEKNYVEGIEIPKLSQKIPPKLKKEDALKLLEVSFNLPYKYKFLRYRNHAIFSMFLFSGLRKKELLNIKLADVDLNNLTLFVRQGKGNKDRILPISFTLAQSLKRYLVERNRLHKTCPEFFTSLNRNKGFTDSGLKRLIAKIKDASQLNFSPHKLRHTFATLMLEGGCDIFSLSKMMGHSDIKTTTIYLSATAEHLRSQVGKHPMNSTYV